MEPFTRMIWFDERVKEQWLPRLAKMAGVYNATEFATFELGMRKAIAYHLLPECLEEQMNMIASGGYVFLPIRRSKIYSGFSHRHIDPKPGDRYFIYGVLAKTLADAKAFRDASTGQKTDHESIGELLGYPECCIEFFNKVWPNTIDPIFEAYGDSASIHPFCNQALRYFGLRITPHLCCSPECKETAKWGEQWFNIMQGLDKNAANDLFYVLSLPFQWSSLNGCAIIDNELFRGVTNSNMQKRKVVNLGWKST